MSIPRRQSISLGALTSCICERWTLVLAVRGDRLVFRSYGGMVNGSMHEESAGDSGIDNGNHSQIFYPV